MSNLYDVSDRLKVLKNRFARHSTIQMNAEGVNFIVGEIEQLRLAALKLEHEVSCKRWNAAAQRERDETDAVLQAVAKPGSNIRLFPAIDRSSVFDGPGVA